jgi:hypothetical protein
MRSPSPIQLRGSVWSPEARGRGSIQRSPIADRYHQVRPFAPRTRCALVAVDMI